MATTAKPTTDVPPSVVSGDGGSGTASPSDGAPVKPALKKKKNRTSNKKDLKWDEAKIQEHDQLRGTRMKIEEPNTPYAHNYDSGSETDGSHNAHKDKELSWNHLQNKLEATAAVRDAYPSSPSSHGGDGEDTPAMTEEEKQEELRRLEFKEHRKRHYNEMELVRKFRQEHPEGILASASDEEDGENDADGEDN